LGSFLKRLEIYTTIPSNTIIEIMLEILSVLAQASKQIKQGRFSECAITFILFMTQCAIETFAKKLIGEGELETALQTLDQLAQDEARVTVVQTLDLAANVETFTEGAPYLHNRSRISEYLFD
jgi:hypothetical protein